MRHRAGYLVLLLANAITGPQCSSPATSGGPEVEEAGDAGAVDPGDPRDVVGQDDPVPTPDTTIDPTGDEPAVPDEADPTGSIPETGAEVPDAADAAGPEIPGCEALDCGAENKACILVWGKPVCGGCLDGYKFDLFRTARHIPLDAIITDMAVEDFDHDGWWDVAARVWNSDDIHLHLGNGNSLFANAPLIFPIGTSPAGIASGDFDNDGIVDLLAYSTEPAGFTILFGGESAPFSLKIAVDIAYVPHRAVVSDIDDDGDLDVLFSLSTATQSTGYENTTDLALFRGDGSGGFDAQYLEYDNLSKEVHAMAVGTIDQDPFEDLVVAMFEKMFVLYGKPDHSFTDPVPVEGGWSHPDSLALVDLDGDGHDDLLAGDHKKDLIFVMLSDGDGFPVLSSTLTLPRGLGGIEAVDMDEDGNQDVLVRINTESADFVKTESSVALYRGLGDGGFQPMKGRALAVESFSETCSDLAARDLNHDGTKEVIMSAYTGLFILRQEGAGEFDSMYAFDLPESNPFYLRRTDYDQNGRDDLFVVHPSFGRISILFDGGEGAVATDKHENPVDLEFGDMNGDSVADMVVLQGVSLFDESRMIATTLSYAAGQSKQKFVTKIDHDCFGSHDLALGDLDMDSHPDVALSCKYYGNICIIRGKGDGTYHEDQEFIEVNGAAGDIRISDLDRDGYPDVVVSNTGTDTFSVLLNDGSGGFLPEAVYPYGGSGNVLVEDFDLDGLPDIAVSHAAKEAVWILAGTDDGTFVLANTIPIGLYDVGSGDWNDDGIPDLAAYRHVAGDLAVLVGQGDFTFAQPSYYPTGDSPSDILAGDFDGDGLDDLGVVNYWSGSVWQYYARPVPECVAD